MGLLDDTTQQQYYQGNDFGNYQFTSLNDIINQFMIVYVGEDKIISKIKRTDVAFHAQRAMQELSFDTFKSCKSQEITVPASLQMVLPHDYVNYTKISWVDSAGIKHLLYPVSKTSNPFSVLQDDDGNYTFQTSGEQLVINADFEDSFVQPWYKSSVGPNTVTGSSDSIAINDGVLTFTHYVKDHYGNPMSRAYAAWQAIDVTGVTKLEISATGTSAAASGTALAGTLYFGISSVNPLLNAVHHNDPAADTLTNAHDTIAQPESSGTSPNTIKHDLGYIEWIDGEQGTSQSLTEEDGDEIDVSEYTTVWVRINSFVDYTSAQDAASVNSIDDISVVGITAHTSLVQKNNTGNSETWKSYKSATPSENQDDYQDDIYWPIDGERYGLDPQHSQANGSFYIDCVSGKIHFSSNISGKTVVLDYISDSLGTDGEMQVHKFAEEAMYKWISHAVLASRANTPEYLVARYKRERFVAIRQAKLRLSNIKLEEITQILRGKSKQIKH